MPTPAIKMVIFTAPGCGVCTHLKKAVLPHFKKANPSLKIEEVEASLDGSGSADIEARADLYGVKSFPAIFFELDTPLAKGGGGDCTLNGLNKLAKEASEALKKAGGA
jgi:thioredoxin-related protein